MNVLIIPEDFRKDQHLLVPILRAMFESLGRRSAHVTICLDPLLGGVDQALNWERIQEIVSQYPMVDLFLLCVDRDGLPGRMDRLTWLETQAKEFLPSNHLLYGENAWEEIETWALAGLDLPSTWKWSEIRAEVSAKEVYFEKFASQRGLSGRPDGGRSVLGREAAGNYPRIRQRCPDDVYRLERRIGTWLEKR